MARFLAFLPHRCPAPSPGVPSSKFGIGFHFLLAIIGIEFQLY
jgi:hypothetical protein